MPREPGGHLTLTGIGEEPAGVCQLESASQATGPVTRDADPKELGPKQNMGCRWDRVPGGGGGQAEKQAAEAGQLPPEDLGLNSVGEGF